MISESKANVKAEIEQTNADRLLEIEKIKAEETNNDNLDGKKENQTAKKKFAFNFKDNPDLKNILLLVLFYVIQGINEFNHALRKFKINIISIKHK